MSADRIKNDLNANLYVEASAGAGKTAALVDRVCALVASGKFTIEQIVAITFTKAAASELRYRIMESLEAMNSSLDIADACRKAIETALAGMSNAPFQTIDSFARKLLSEYHAAADMPPLQNTTATDLEAAVELKMAWNEWLDEKLDSDERFVKYFNLARDYGFDGLIRRIWPNQKLIDNFSYEYRSLLDYDFNVSADYDYTGLLHWIHYSRQLLEKLLPSCVVDDDRLRLHLDKQVKPLIDRLCQTRLDSREYRVALTACANVGISKDGGVAKNWQFDSALAYELRDFLSSATHELRRFLSEESYEELLLRINPESLAELNGKQLTRELLSFLNVCIDLAYQPQARHVAGALLDYARQFTLKYIGDKCERGEPGFTGVLIKTFLLLKNNQAIRREVSKRYPVVLVDEFQDTNPLQVELIRLLTSASANGGAPSGRLFAVGDLKQSIYMFRGADPYISNQIRDELARQGGLVKLEFNYRSLPPLVDWVKNLFNPIFTEMRDLLLREQNLDLDLCFDATAKKQEILTPQIRVSGSEYISGYKSLKSPEVHYENLFVFDPVKNSAALKELSNHGYALTLMSETSEEAALRLVHRDDPASARAPKYDFAKLQGRECYLFVAREQRLISRDLELNLEEVVKDDFEPLHERLRDRELLELIQHIGNGGLRVRDGERERPSRLGDICILFPSRYAAAHLDRLFAENGIPYSRQGAFDLLESPFVQDVINALIAINNPALYANLLAALKSPLFGCSDVDFLKWKRAGGEFDYLDSQPLATRQASERVADAFERLAELHRFSQTNNYTAVIRKLLTDARLKTALLNLGAYNIDEIRKLEILQEQAFATLGSGRNTLTQFLELCEQAKAQARVGMREKEMGFDVSDVASAPGGEGIVKLMTVHAAKGLEFPIVIVLESSRARAGQTIVESFDGRRAINVKLKGEFKTPGYDDAERRAIYRELAEDARLSYVAATRARDHLFISLHRSSRSYGADEFRRFDLGDRKTPPAFAYFLEKHLPPDTRYGFPISTAAIAPPAGGKITLPPRADWLAKRERALANALRPDRVAATQIKTTAELADHAPPAEQARPAETQPDGAGLQIGSAVHDILQTIDLRSPTDRDIAALAAQIANARDLQPHRAAIERMVKATLASPAVRRAVQSERYWREAPATCALKNGALLNCRIDLMYLQADGQIVIVDYKTDALTAGESASDLVRRYELQLAAYALAVARSTNRKIAAARLLFCNLAAAGQAHDFSVQNLPALMRQVDETPLEATD